jgi:hypothetical protein
MIFFTAAIGLGRIGDMRDVVTWLNEIRCAAPNRGM